MTVRQTFWSRRKQAVEAEARQEAEARIAAEEAEARAKQEQKPDDLLLEELGLPDPDTLKAGDDFSVFMSKSVPARLRNRALRKLWVSNPVLANLDDLVDYAEDYRSAGMTGELVRTSYQVGKGLMKHVEQLARAAEQDAPPAPVDMAAVAAEAGEAAPDEDMQEAQAIETAAPETADTDETDAVFAAPKRRMRFVVEANT